MAVDLVQISFSVPRTVATNVAKRAEPLNIRLSEYARRLFEAAYAARVAQERGESSGDRSLDRQVRDVFLLADCEPEFVADALGMPVIRVRRILDGWRQAVAEALPTPAATPEPTVVAAATRLPPPIARKVRSDGYSADQIAVIRAMWREGKEVKDIAAAIGRPAPGLSNWASRHRDICPKRRT